MLFSNNRSIDKALIVADDIRDLLFVFFVRLYTCTFDVLVLLNLVAYSCCHEYNVISILNKKYL